jgi:membrane protease YdiL (CAAX protease family)
VLSMSAFAGVILLYFTKGFFWRSLTGSIKIKPIIILGVITFIFASLICWIILPERFWFIIINAPYVMFAIAILYPIFLVIPQELIYRALFFERYGYLFSSQRQAIFINALLFSFGHLMYWHIVVWFMTFIGSFIFAYAYLRPNGFMQTIALHSIAGIAIFASGLGWLFYSGGNLAQ